MYSKLGIRDRILIDFFGWVTGIRLLNPSRNHTNHEEKSAGKGIPCFYDETLRHESINLMDGGDSIH